MKFTGTPNVLIRMVYKIGMERRTKIIGRFDKDGIFETEDTRIINRMKKYFDNVKDIAQCPDKKEVNAQHITPVIPEKIVRHCKKCSYTTTNQGDLMKHYREEHPKGEQNVTEPITQ